MVEEMPDDAPQEAKEVAAQMVKEMEKEKVLFKNTQEYKGVKISKYRNPTRYGGDYVH